MEKLSFLELAEKVLREEKKPLKAFEIWDIAIKKNYDKLLNSQGVTPRSTFAAQLYVNSKKNNSKFIKVASEPVLFYLKDLPQDYNIDKLAENEIKEEASKKYNYLEKDLHPILAYFGKSYLGTYIKTINHSKSAKKTFGEWLHPDMVGCHFLFEDLKEEVYNLNKTVGNFPIKLYSFELKRGLTFSNLRESFFQTVSNSAWANEGYLVASEISEEEEFLTELKRLSSSYGIGIIKLDISNPDSSKVLYPAKEKENLDWETINKIADRNKDFKNLIIRITKDIEIKEVREEEFDKIKDIKDLILSKQNPSI